MDITSELLSLHCHLNKNASKKGINKYCKEKESVDDFWVDSEEEIEQKKYTYDLGKEKYFKVRDFSYLNDALYFERRKPGKAVYQGFKEQSTKEQSTNRRSPKKNKRMQDVAGSQTHYLDGEDEEGLDRGREFSSRNFEDEVESSYQEEELEVEDPESQDEDVNDGVEYEGYYYDQEQDQECEEEEEEGVQYIDEQEGEGEEYHEQYVEEEEEDSEYELGQPEILTSQESQSQSQQYPAQNYQQQQHIAQQPAPIHYHYHFGNEQNSVPVSTSSHMSSKRTSPSKHREQQENTYQNTLNRINQAESCSTARHQQFIGSQNQSQRTLTRLVKDGLNSTFKKRARSKYKEFTPSQAEMTQSCKVLIDRTNLQIHTNATLLTPIVDIVDASEQDIIHDMSSYSITSQQHQAAHKSLTDPQPQYSQLLETDNLREATSFFVPVGSYEDRDLGTTPLKNSQVSRRLEFSKKNIKEIKSLRQPKYSGHKIDYRSPSRRRFNNSSSRAREHEESSKELMSPLKGSNEIKWEVDPEFCRGESLDRLVQGKRAKISVQEIRSSFRNNLKKYRKDKENKGPRNLRQEACRRRERARKYAEVIYSLY